MPGRRQAAQKVAEMTAESILPGTPYEVIYGSDESSREEMTKLLTEKPRLSPRALPTKSARCCGKCRTQGGRGRFYQETGIMYCYRQRSHVGALPHLRSSARWKMCVNVFHIHMASPYFRTA